MRNIAIVKNAYKIVIGKFKERPRHGWEDNIEIYLKEIGCKDWTKFM
jgi:hypothetical protein